MKAYLQATESVSPQDTFNCGHFPKVFSSTNLPYLKCVEPDYKQFIPAGARRRMGRIVKMSIAAALSCLNKGKETSPGAIIVGTGLGCVADTESFLLNMIENNEEHLTPTSFIQSTHNTVAGQIALLLGCNNYNFTYVHGGFSFENALLDGLMHLQEGEKSVLVGGVDEMTNNNYSIYKKLGYWKDTVPGEGAAFFLLSNSKEKETVASVEGLELIYNPDQNSIAERANVLLENNGLKVEDIDLLVLGVNNRIEEDLLYYSLMEKLFSGTAAASFKNISGDYSTASSFGLWFTNQIIKEQKAPASCWLSDDRPDKIRNVLLCNSYRKDFYSLTLVRAC